MAVIRAAVRKLFCERLELLQALDSIGSLAGERAEVAATLCRTVASMNPDNFLVRPHLELVERFSSLHAWETISLTDLAALADRVAKLPDELDADNNADNEDAKRFDIVMLNAQLGLLRHTPFERQRTRIIGVASALEDLGTTIPAVAQQQQLIAEVQTDEWWADVTYPMIEDARKRLRGLVHLIKHTSNNVLYSDFTDELGQSTEIELPGTGGSVPSIKFDQFRKKAQHFLKEHLAEGVVAKVRSGEPLTTSDIEELQRILVAAGIGDTHTFAAASARAGNFGLFIRSLVGLDRTAAMQAFATFLDDKRYSVNQISFVTMVIDYLTEHGSIEAGHIYNSPFTALAPEGPEAILLDEVDEFFEIVKHFHDSAYT